MERWVTRRWAKQSTINVTDLEEKFFLIRFHAQEDYAYALFEGPWMIADHYLLVQRWIPLFFPHEMRIQKVAVWVRIHNLPVELYNKYFLGKVGNSQGTMLKIDGYTSIHSREKFARICVEVDLRQQLVLSFSALAVSIPESSPSNLPEYSTDKRLEQPHAKEDQNQSQKGKEQIESENLAVNQESNGQDISMDTPQIMAIKDQQQSSPFGSWMAEVSPNIATTPQEIAQQSKTGKQGDHQDYLRSFSYILREQAKVHREGGYVPIGGEVPSTIFKEGITPQTGPSSSRADPQPIINYTFDPGDIPYHNNSGSKYMVEDQSSNYMVAGAADPMRTTEVLKQKMLLKEWVLTLEPSVRGKNSLERGHIKRRLDRVLSSFKWAQLFQAAGVKHLSKLKSDHLPILIDFQHTIQDNSNKPFRNFPALYEEERQLIAKEPIDEEIKAAFLIWVAGKLQEQMIYPQSFFSTLGIRTAKENNKLFLMKLAWMLINNKESIWVKVLRRDGKEVAFWTDQWIAGIPKLSDLALEDIHSVIKDNVANYANSDGTWKLNILNQMLPSEAIDMIRSNKAPQWDLGEDMIC
ncbi:hypothetical protein Ahy_A10g047827 [Arachis hypogaea]|uniref:DUF4283 domain-containing protein n=1 Tax=Arachis hypogaea TaxID=3818 RepID=A0A445B3N5_ARAHY|nr:hypothetical protein Ahy_A10g047827 [Arachis hypogaea]